MCGAANALTMVAMTAAGRTLAGIALLAPLASAQRLAFQSFGVGEGLANSAVSDAFEDSNGFLWIATWEGLSRFDGASFVNYGTRDGLGALLVNSVTEDARGRLWVATNGAGVARLIDAPERGDTADVRLLLISQRHDARLDQRTLSLARLEPRQRDREP